MTTIATTILHFNKNKLRGSIDALFSEMSGLALSQGSLLNVFQGKRSYQPVWQVGIPHSFFEVKLGLDFTLR